MPCTLFSLNLHYVSGNLKSEYHACDALRAWRPQKMADSRVYMSDFKSYFKSVRIYFTSPYLLFFISERRERLLYVKFANFGIQLL